MSHFKIDDRDIYFILKQQLNYGSLCQCGRYRDLDEDTLDMLVTEAIKFAKGVVSPLQVTGDRQGIGYDKGNVRTADGFREAFRLYGENGWVAATGGPEYGGQGFPRMMGIVLHDIMYGACASFTMAPGLTHGAGRLIESFAVQELKDRFVGNMYSGRWAGTMCLTEPQAGSNLASIRTKAIRDGDRFRIKGTKIFISWGEHDLTENIIHLVLARIENAPQGVKGISLFVVPKVGVNEDGSLGKPNDVICTGVEHKMGLHGSPTCVLNFGDNDDCIGYLCGEENKGLAHMFQMMNSARIKVGVSGLGVAGTAYRNALAYSKERIQGTDVARRKPGEVPIIDHPDIRRMLLWMKATVDGMRSMAYTAGLWWDLSEESEDPRVRRRYQLLMEFITPLVKSYCSDMCFKVCELAVQCLGGYGFTREYPLEQYLRDSKIFSLYEGTNGIQSMDLMGRKLIAEDGASIKAFLGELRDFCAMHRDHSVLREHVRALADAAAGLQELARDMAGTLQSDPLQWASKTYDGLLCFAEAVMVWRLLDMAAIAQERIDAGDTSDFYVGKVIQARYYADVTLPGLMARLRVCARPSRDIVDMPVEAF